MPQSITPSTPFIPALPAIIEQLPPDSARPQQSQFTRDRQAVFLRRLADTGEVRVAARAASVSHQTVYRLRRSCAAFRRGVDAALVIARELAEDMLASRAMNGTEEDVLYHGEVVATRRRYDSRLLLAHLARLDKKAEGEDVAQLVGAFDAVVEAFEDAGLDAGAGAEAGADGEGAETARVVLPNLAAIGAFDDGLDAALEAGRKGAESGGGSGGENLPLGPCNMRSMSSAEMREDEPGQDEPGEDEARLDARLEAMEAARPQDALTPAQVAATIEETDELEWAQLLAFEAGEPRWWEAEPQPEEPLVEPNPADRAGQAGTCEQRHSCRS